MTSRKVRRQTPSKDGAQSHSHSVRFDHETWQALVKGAQKEERDPSGFIKLMVRDGLRRRGLLEEQKV